ncbi:MAG: MFS transporter [Rhodospirillaceae bacterium]|nr:MFS transporter [Rhodospirillaceae bacterium]
MGELDKTKLIQNTSNSPNTWKKSISVYFDKRIAVIFLLGFSSGLPLALTLGTLSIWLSRSGIDKTTIGLFSAVSLPYVFKFVWAPLIDQIKIPFLTNRLGRRRGWVVFTQIGLILTIALMGGIDPITNPGLLAIIALAVAFCSASQYIVIDAYRVEVLEENKLGAGAASVVFGYRVGMLASGAGALYLADSVNWGLVYLIMASLIFVGLITILFSPEPLTPIIKKTNSAIDWLKEAIIAPFFDFIKRPGWIVILLFVIFYKFGDSLVGVMTNPFLVETGFTNSEIANVAKIYGFAATMIGFAAGGIMIAKLGILNSLWVCGFLQLVSNLLFILQASVGHDTAILAVVLGFENLAGGMGTAAFVAYLSSLCNVSYTATQYALLSALMAAGRTFLSVPSGWFADILGWVPFFILTTGAAVPGLLLLGWISYRKSKEFK